jgi:hypothetical protein
VSSINAKAQSHLESTRIRDQHHEGIRSSCVSLSALMTDLERISIHSDSDQCDANSLCSEPVKMYDYNDFNDRNNLHTNNKNNISAAMTNSINDLFDFCTANNNKSTVSLSGLDMTTAAVVNKEAGGGVGGYTSELNVSQIEDRSDSPILEGIDQELAKYAKLKDLEQAYHPTIIAKSNNAGKQSNLLLLQRNPDGASNPDLNYKPASNVITTSSDAAVAASINGNCVPLPLRRSPGNGRSGSEPEPEEFERSLKATASTTNNFAPSANNRGCSTSSDGHSMSSGGSVPTKSSPSGCSSMSSSSGGAAPPRVAAASILHRPLSAKRSSRDERTVLGKSQSTDTSSDLDNSLDIWQKPKQPPQSVKIAAAESLAAAVVAPPPVAKSKGPKFSRLFKLSRSPLKVVKDEAKSSSRRSKSADSRNNKAEALKVTQQPPPASPLVGKDKKSSSQTSSLASTKLKLIDKRTASTSSLKQPQQSKNAKGTSSSVACSTTTAAATIKNKKQQKISILPSPYAFPSAPKKSIKNAVATASTASSGSGYDSGHDSGIVKTSSRFIKTCTFVKLRSKGGRGASTNKTPITASKRASQRKSSGYESSAGGVDSSERDSIDSLKGITEAVAAAPIVQQTTRIYHRPNLEAVSVVDYDAGFIQRLDERWRIDEVRRLQHKQRDLKIDLSQAKAMIGADPARWSYGLHVSDSVLGGLVASTDPSIIEALDKETTILGKRVAAAKSHAILTTSFDVNMASKDLQMLSPMTSKLLDNCCTTDCDPAQTMILSSTSKETEIF